MLTPEQKACRQQFSEENLDMLRANPETFLSTIITGDETWFHRHDQEAKQEPTQWNTRGPYSQETSCATINWKDHGNSFFGVLLLEFTPHQTIITGDMLLQWWLYARILKETPWKFIGWCPAVS